MKLSVSKVIVVLTCLSLFAQIYALVHIIPNLQQPIDISLLWVALLVELGAFGVLIPFMRLVYERHAIQISRTSALKLVLASEGYSHIIPFGDYILQRYLFTKKRKPKGPIVDYIVLLYSFALISLASLFLLSQVLVTLLYPNKITDDFAGRFSIIPFAFTVAILAIYFLRRKGYIIRPIQKFAVKCFGERLKSPLAVLKKLNLNARQTILLVMPLVFTWIIEAGAYTICMYMFNIDAPYILLLYAYTFVKVFRFVPIFPGGVGEIEAASTLLLPAYGYPVASVLGGAIFFRVLSYWLPVILGGLGFVTLVKGDKLQ